MEDGLVDACTDSKVHVDVAWLDGDVAAVRAGSLEKSVPFSVVVDGGRLLHLRSVVLSMSTSHFVLVTNILNVFLLLQLGLLVFSESPRSVIRRLPVERSELGLFLFFVVFHVGSVVAPRLVSKLTVTSVWPTTRKRKHCLSRLFPSLFAQNQIPNS